MSKLRSSSSAAAPASSTTAKTAAKNSLPPTPRQPPPPVLSPVQQQLAALVLEPGVRVALRQALSEPAVADALQAVLVAVLTTGKAGARQCFLEKLPNLVPILTRLVAARPELLAVSVQLFAILKGDGVVRGGCGPWGPMMMGLFGIGCGGGGGGGGGGCHRTMASSTSVGGIPGRATRDVNWRSHLGEGIKALSTKLAEAAAATTAAAATAVDVAAESVGIASPVTSHGRKKVECAQVAAAIEASKKSKEDLDLQKAVNASLEAMSTLTT